jgi:uncharacterized protein (DUF2062 family)
MVDWFIRTSCRIWRESIAKLKIIFIHPVLHAKHPPEYTARGVGVGLFVAFTPFFGAHIAIVFALWAIAKAVNGNFAFNPVLASVWTLLSNVFTIAPLFYVFIQTGKLMLGRWDNIQSFGTYLPEFEQTPYVDSGWIAVLSVKLVSLLAGFGIPLFIGCLPWAICIGVMGYISSLYFIRRHRSSIRD